MHQSGLSHGSAQAPPLQEAAHGEGHDYLPGSPHLKHRGLNERLVSLLRSEVHVVQSRGLPLSVLEIGAGDGGFTRHALALGCEVTATEMSRSSLNRLRERFRGNNRFEGVFDADGSLAVLGDRAFSLIVCASVLHHIPDYEAFVQKSLLPLLREKGSLLTLQDPMWHPDMKKSTRLFDRTSYFLWRLTRGNYRQGLQTRLRRLRGVYDQTLPADMGEYHVVRSGVDQNILIAALARRFESVRPVFYWATQSSFWQRMGEIGKVKNTFALVADGFRCTVFLILNSVPAL